MWMGVGVLCSHGLFVFVGSVEIKKEALSKAVLKSELNREP